MRNFAFLYNELDATGSAQSKVAALERYLRSAAPEDAAWAVSLLLGDTPACAVTPRELREFAAASSGAPDWLVERCYVASGDLSETVALLVTVGKESHETVSAKSGVSNHSLSEQSLAWWLESFLAELRGADRAEKELRVTAVWRQLTLPERIVFNKLLSGTFRARAQRSIVERALAQAFGLPRAVVSQRLSAGWTPTPDAYRSLVAPMHSTEADGSEPCGALPYPFQPIETIGVPCVALGDCRGWQGERLMRGSVRVQLLRREGCTAVWSSDHANCTEQLPELVAIGRVLPESCVMEGVAIGWNRDGGCPASQSFLERRLESTSVSDSRAMTIEVKFIASDLLELDSRDLRGKPLRERRALLEQTLQTLADTPVKISVVIPLDTWSDLDALLDECPATCSEGILLKRWDSPYSGASGEAWRFLRARQHEIKAVLLYAEAARGQAPSRFTNYTFAVWAEPGGERVLVPIAKTGDGFTDVERRQVDRFVQQNTRERHGPVRVVKPELAVRLQFDAVEESPRHKAGLTLRSPRVAALLPELDVSQVDTLETVRSYVHAGARAGHAGGRDG